MSRNPDFSALPHCCVLYWTDWSLEKFVSFKTQHKNALAITKERLELWEQRPQLRATFD